jgi:Dolichyl-phosphate-mannose-protein mannosyltransferase
VDRNARLGSDASAHSARSARPRDLAFTLAAGLVALWPRLFVAIAWAKEPVWDGHYYHFGAERIARGLGYSEDVLVHGVPMWKPWAHYPVGYSALLGGVYKLFGTGLIVAPIANALIGALLVVVVHRLARYYLSDGRAAVAAGLAAVHPGLIAYSALVMTEPLASLLLLSSVYAALHFRGRWLALVASGALLGFAALVRPSSLLAAPLLALTEPLTGLHSWPKALARAALSSLVALLVISPWTVRNCVRMDGCALVSTNGGWNLAIGALTETGRFQTLRAKDGCPVVTGQVQQDRCWAEVARRKIAQNPEHWLALAPQKLSQTFDHESFAVEYLREADPNAWPEPRRLAARELFTAFHRALLVVAAFCVAARPRWQRAPRLSFFTQVALIALLALAGAYAVQSDLHPFFLFAVFIPLLAVLSLPGHPPQGPAGSVLIGILAITCLTHVIFFGDDRYHIVVTPVLCILAAAALRRPEPHETSNGA